ncbi:ABC transporter permease subunit [Spiroplasma citri]|uniref:Uncharacterized protein n=3 Tax=Spiroplasma citri TaxID=2133 RepID=A0AAJ4EJH5_SPICI|nr:ABC transporter permease [Spiroplasma citri]QED24761.1 hypothetical protein FRX96_04870 [Spiroplasma citri]QIA69010.1 hypothetical protein GL298_05495 [Spiroplasma citri]QIA70862.1 ABC transporter permease subunit [Spiroplasma citri]QIA72880.1 ABC transporter permease subunit [Spiroplasma citri]QJU61726.1 ABC transporter permease subunit [Spiroplasma citri]
MINLKFVKLQFKNIKIILIISSILFFLLTILAITLKYFSPSTDIDVSDAASFVSFVMYGYGCCLIMIFPYSIITTHILLTKEIKEGYFACWLVLPMSRKAVLNSKIFTLISSIIILNVGSLFLQLILFSLVYKDFNQQNQINLVLTSFSFLFLWILWSFIVWVISCYFDKSGVSISILSFISILFLLFGILSFTGEISGTSNPNLEKLKYLKFLTIISFFNSALNFADLPHSSLNIIIAEPLQPKSLDFCWQLPTMFVLSSGLFSLGNWIFIKKSLSL